MPFLMLLDGSKIVGEAQSGSGIISNNIVDKKKHIDYFYDNEGIRFARIGASNYELLKDALNNVVAVIDLEEGKLACAYRYDAYGNCTVLDENGNVDTNKSSVGNILPFRWKSFYYDVETNLYYANGSYYDPTTGTYLDASPIASIFDNIPQLTNLDRNAPMCNNILELASNPYTVNTATSLSPDTTYEVWRYAPWYIRLQVRFSKWSRESKFKTGVVFLAIALIASVFFGNPGIIFAEVAIGIGIGVSSYLLSPIFTGQALTGDGLADAIVDSFLITSAFVFVSTAFNAIKMAVRTSRIKRALRANVEVYRQLLPRQLNSNQLDNLKFATATYDVRLGTYTYAFNSEIVGMTDDMLNAALRGVGAKTSCAEIQAINKALNAGSYMGDLYVYTVNAQTGNIAYACRVCTRVLDGNVAEILTGLFR